MKVGNGWQNDKKKSDVYLQEIKGILGLHLIGEPPIEEDTERNTDLMVLRMEAVRIGCRVRGHEYLMKYGGEFTIRSGRPSGIKTELTKIIEGWGDYFFYGFGDILGRGLIQWTLADLRVFRRWYMSELWRMGPESSPGLAMNNRDNSSSFRVFKWDDLPPEFVVGTSRIKTAEVA